MWITLRKVNDIYGHLSGDAMLVDIADMLRRLFPENAVLARVGGDEFAVLLYHENHGGGGGESGPNSQKLPVNLKSSRTI